MTRLALAQRAVLRDELAGRGVDLHCVVVADDENLDIADDFGFWSVYRSNDELGRKVNDGIELALRRGAEYVAFIGSDDWLHADLFAPLVDRPDAVVAGQEVAVVDLERGQLRHLGARGRYGVAPWFVPRSAFGANPRPLKEKAMRALDLHLKIGLARTTKWLFYDPHPLARVDFKTDINITPYAHVCRMLGVGPEINAWDALAEKYPEELVHMGRMAQAARLAVAA